MGLKAANGLGAKPRLYLVERHPLLREGFAELLKREGDLDVCGNSADASTALKELAELRPDLAIIDIELKHVSGLELIKRVKELFPEMRTLAVSMYNELLYAERALRAGAGGYVMKQSPVEDVIAAVRWVLRGDRYLSPQMQTRLLKVFCVEGENGSTLDRLSERELQVFQLLGSGARMQEIARQLRVSVKTIETYRAHLIHKLNFKNGLELLQYAVHMATEQRNRPPTPRGTAKGL